jgi:hypothetical protein
MKICGPVDTIHFCSKHSLTFSVARSKLPVFENTFEKQECDNYKGPRMFTGF